MTDNVVCIDCMHLCTAKDLYPEYPRLEKWGCRADESTKDDSDIHAVRSCSRYLEGDHIPLDLPPAPTGQDVQCQYCGTLRKITYKEAKPTHHENWQCPSTSKTMQLEDTHAKRKCGSYKRGTPKDLSSGEYR
jgi:hypothetical protein